MEALREENQRLMECVDEQRRHIAGLAKDASVTADADVGIAGLMNKLTLKHGEDIEKITRFWREKLQSCIDQYQHDKVVAQRLLDETHMEMNALRVSREEMRVAVVNMQCYATALCVKIQEADAALYAAEEMTAYWKGNAENYLLCVDEQQRHLRCVLVSNTKGSEERTCDSDVGIETLITRFRKSESAHYEKRAETLRRQYIAEYTSQLKKMQEIIFSKVRHEFKLKNVVAQKPEVVEAFVKSADNTVASLRVQLTQVQQQLTESQSREREAKSKITKLSWVYSAYSDWKSRSNAKNMSQKEAFTEKRLKVLQNLVTSLQGERDKVKERDLIIRRLTAVGGACLKNF